MEGGADTLCEALGVPKRPLQGDTPVIQAIRLIDRRPQDFARVKDIAKVAGLSASRFQVLVREATGMAFRRYRLWRRMSIVMHHVARGETLTTTAYAAGFASSAHLSTTFKAMFGISPSRVLAMRPEFDLEPL
ncbi:MAG: AraC family transcriptional regulator [Myxococcota bacterium]